MRDADLTVTLKACPMQVVVDTPPDEWDSLKVHRTATLPCLPPPGTFLHDRDSDARLRVLGANVAFGASQEYDVEVVCEIVSFGGESVRRYTELKRAVDAMLDGKWWRQP